ncbi:DinB family protein [Spirosoma humi]
MEAEKTNSQNQLNTTSQAFISWVDGLTDEQFWANTNGKWSVAEVIQHLYLSARPVARLLTGPRAILDQWGRPTASSRPYEEIKSAYQNVLATGAKAPATMSPRSDDRQVSRSELMERFRAMYQSLVEALKNWSATELDNYCIPHPVLGKLTVREMIYFTSIHTEHHRELLQQVYNRVQLK